jgi:hypothetical protein
MMSVFTGYIIGRDGFVRSDRYHGQFLYLIRIKAIKMVANRIHATNLENAVYARVKSLLTTRSVLNKRPVRTMFRILYTIVVCKSF